MLPKDNDRGFDLGVDYLTKPFTCHELLSAINLKLTRSNNNIEHSLQV